MKKHLLALAFLFALSPSIALAQSAPTVSYLGPSTVSVGDTVYVYGANYNNATFAVIDGPNGVSPTIQVISSTSFSFVVPSSLGTGSHTIAVAEKAGSWDLGSPISFTVVATPQAPTISYIGPTTAQAGDTVYVYGANFNTATFLAFYNNNTVLDTTYLSPTKLSFVVPSSLGTGEHTLGVAEKAGPWNLGSAAKLTVGSIPQAPTISYVSPSSVKIGETVYVYGANFNTATFIGVDGGKGPVVYATYISPTKLRFVVPSSFSAGTHSLAVAEKAGSWDLSSSVNINILSKDQILPVTTPVTPSNNNEEQIKQLQTLLMKLIQQLIELLQKQAASVIMSQPR